MGKVIVLYILREGDPWKAFFSKGGCVVARGE
jgi:hypothetical protein